MNDQYSLGEVTVSLSPKERFEEYLRSRGMRNTAPRRLLIEHVFSRHDHFDVDALIDQLPSKGQTGYMGRATVYRTLNDFVDAGLLRKMELDGRAVYEHDYAYPQHDHLYCTECGGLFEFHSEDLIALRNAVARDHRFRVAGHRLIIQGVCDKCSKSKRRVKRRQDLL